MNNELYLDIDYGEDAIFTGDQYLEFCKYLDLLEECGSEYTEAVVDKHSKLYNDKKSIIKNTANTVSDTFSIYSDITDSNGMLIKSIWNLMIKMIRLITSITSYVTNKVATIPMSIANTIDYITNLPASIKNKLAGNINLYISINDIEVIYNQLIMVKLETFISNGRELSEGDLWGTLFRRHDYNADKTKDVKSSNNDIKICKNMEKIYADLKSVQFIQNIINMHDPAIVDKYFFNKNAIKFRDLSGKDFSGSYLESLKKLIDDLNLLKDDLNKVSKSVGEKYERTQFNKTFIKLNKFDQNRVIRVIRMISKVVALVGFMIKYTIHDVNEINGHIKKVIKNKENRTK